jgi:hypothetical protein
MKENFNFLSFVLPFLVFFRLVFAVFVQAQTFGHAGSPPCLMSLVLMGLVFMELAVVVLWHVCLCIANIVDLKIQINVITCWNSTQMILSNTHRIFDHIGNSGYQSFSFNAKDIANYSRYCKIFECFATCLKVLCWGTVLKIGILMLVYKNLLYILKEYLKLVESNLFKEVKIIARKDLFNRNLLLTAL